MKLLSRVLFICLISSFASASEKESFDFFKDYNSDYQEMMRVKATPKIRTRGPASVKLTLGKAQLEKKFFLTKWSNYSNLTDEIRRSVIKKFNEKGLMYSLDQMVTFIQVNKESLSKEERIKAAELRGQYDALLSWN